MREICRYSGFNIVATIERGGTTMHPQLSEKDKQNVYQIGYKQVNANKTSRMVFTVRNSRREIVCVSIMNIPPQKIV